MASIQTRTISVQMMEPDGTPLVGARVEITLIGLGVDLESFVAPGPQMEFTDATGRAVFTLWQNNDFLSDTNYEISSWHPETGAMIHRKEPFKVFASDADVKDLVELSPVPVVPSVELIKQLTALRAEIYNILELNKSVLAQALTVASEIDSDLLGVTSQTLKMVAGSTRVFELGPKTDAHGPIVYRVSGVAIAVNANIATFTPSIAGTYLATLVADSFGGRQDTAFLLFDVVPAEQPVEFLQAPIQVV